MTRWIARSAALFILWAAAAHAVADAPFSLQGTPGKLPKDVLPIEYAIRVVPDMAARTFRGEQTITIDVRRATTRIVMNGLDIQVDRATLRRPGRAPMVLGMPSVDAQRQTLTWTLERPLAPGRYALDMAWRGVIGNTPQGLYADSYAAQQGEKHMLATMMEPISARRLLPSWDEPVFRARFRLSVDLPDGYAAVSNMPVATTQALPGNMRRTIFDTTPRMSSYLLALVAADDLRRVEENVDGTRIGIVVTQGKEGRAGYALEAGRQLLRYYNDYFGTSYPLPKLDHIGMAGGFQGAMENWGAIVYNESGLLVDPQTSPESTRRHVFGLMAHEMAHQWFGNLVTMAWWDNLWLNEGFAQWMGTKATDRFNPQWHVWLSAGVGREEAMELDARSTTHPIQQPVSDDTEAHDSFDYITYEKGSGFLRMLESYLGEEPFRAGIRAYMARHRYSNTTTADLWAALTDASGKPVRQIADDWATQPGFPVIKVQTRCEGETRYVTLQQEQFRVDGAPPGERLWAVPVAMGIVGRRASDYALLRGRSETLERSGCDAALLVDPDNVGIYRVRYARPDLELILAAWPLLPDAARFKLLADMKALMSADLASLDDYLALLRRIDTESRLAVWREALEGLELLDRLSMGDPSRDSLRRFAVARIGPRFAELGWNERPGESVEDRQLRGVLARALANYGDAATIAAGQERFARFLEDPSSLPPSLAATVTHIAGRYAKPSTYDALKALAERSRSTEDKFRYYRALAGALDPALAARSLALARSSDVPQIMRNEFVWRVAEAEHLDAAWDYAREHADALLADMSAARANRYLGGIVQGSASAEHADQLLAFVKTRLPASALPNAERSADEIRMRARLKTRVLPQLGAALRTGP